MKWYRLTVSKPSNALPPLHRAQSQIHLPPPSPYMPAPSQVHPSFSRPPTTQALPDPRSAHARAVGSQQLDVPRLSEYDDLPPLPSLLNQSTIPSRNDEIEVVDTPTHTSTAANRRRKPNEIRNRPSPPANDTKRGGRNLGSKGFSMPEDGKVVDCVEEVQPIGGDGWEKVAVKYNTWAKEKGYPERTVQSLKKRFERVSREVLYLLVLY